MNEPDLEERLRAHYRVRVEPFRHHSFSVEMLLPSSADELIDDSEFNVDERLPYWADLWPSARALTRHLLEHPPAAGPVLELGCGVALPTLALHARGIDMLATDYYDEALQFARVNALRNGLPPLPTRLLDWRAPPPDLGKFPLVLAADVLYERRNADALAALLPQIVAPGGGVLLADPGRVYRDAFETAMRQQRWRVAEEAVRSESSAADAVSRVRIVRLRAPDA